MLYLNIKKFRLQMDMTQADIAKRLGVTPSAYAMYERGEREPNLEILVALAEIFNTDMNGITGYQPSQRKTTNEFYVTNEHTMNNEKEIGKIVRQLRGNRSLREFAELCDISHTALDAIECGINKRSKKPTQAKAVTLQRIAEAAGVPLSYITCSKPITETNVAKLNQNIKAHRKKIDLTQEELGERLGVSKQAISMYESGDRIPPIDILNKMADIFKINVDQLIGRPSTTKIPVLGYVVAGIPIEAVEDILDYEEISPDMLKDGSKFFALKLKGSSMEPRMSDGDVVIVRIQSTLDSGDIGIVCINGEHATCRKVMKQSGGIVLQPLNPAYDPVFYSNEQIEDIPITILGRVVELRAKF